MQIPNQGLVSDALHMRNIPYGLKHVSFQYLGIDTSSSNCHVHVIQ